MVIVKRINSFLVCILPVLVFACSSSKPAYQKPILQPRDIVLARFSKTVFTPAEVCATKTGGLPDQVTNGCRYMGTSAEAISKLQEDQVIVYGCLGAYGHEDGGPAAADDLVLYRASKGGGPNPRPQVEAGDVVLVRGAGIRVSPGDCLHWNGDARGEMFPAVKVVKVEEGELQFSFLNKNTEDAHKEAVERASGQDGVYKAKEWWVPSPKLTEVLKKP